MMNFQKTNLIRIIMYFCMMTRHSEVEESYSEHRYLCLRILAAYGIGFQSMSY